MGKLIQFPATPDATNDQLKSRASAIMLGLQDLSFEDQCLILADVYTFVSAHTFKEQGPALRLIDLYLGLMWAKYKGE